jgi:hypothetical protein
LNSLKSGFSTTIRRELVQRFKSSTFLKKLVQDAQIVQSLRSVQVVLQLKNRFQSFQWFHRLRGSKRNDFRSLAKEISPTGEGVNALRRGSRFQKKETGSRQQATVGRRA